MSEVTPEEEAETRRWAKAKGWSPEMIDRLIGYAKANAEARRKRREKLEGRASDG